MKKQILILNIFLFFAILFPAYSMDFDYTTDEINRVSPPEWILGTWVITDDLDDPFMVEFTKTDFIFDGHSIVEDIVSGFITGYTQEITEEYYDMYIRFYTGDWGRERFFRISTNVMESRFVSSDGLELFSTYYRD
ncbi:MAG: hypothetical protein FWD87_02665 [Spirochaetaceae bacterium]|nr:hypothetical protein [Spirochaetaceae bacterium]